MLGLGGICDRSFGIVRRNEKGLYYAPDEKMLALARRDQPRKTYVWGAPSVAVTVSNLFPFNPRRIRSLVIRGFNAAIIHSYS